jgi:hypothetical protein
MGVYSKDMRRRFLFALFVCAFGLVALMLARRAREPEFKGRKVHVWFEAFFGTIEDLRESEVAFRAMGTNALPYLRKELVVPDSRLRTTEASWRVRLGVINGIGMKARNLRPLPREVRARAVYLAALASGRVAIPDLIPRLADPEPDVRIAAATALRSFGTSASIALPSLSRLTNDQSTGKSTYAGTMVGARAGEALRAISGQDTNTYVLAW